MTYESQRIKFDREHIYIVEIDFDNCALIHGTAPCTATETGDDKCYNTLSTCNDLPNYNHLITSGSHVVGAVAATSEYSHVANLWITLGFYVGQRIMVSGFSVASNNGIKDVTAVTANRLKVSQAVVADVGNGPIMDLNPPYIFCQPRSPHPIGLNAIPSLSSVSIAPSEIEIKGGLGVRSSVSMTFKDHPHDDIDLDNYVTDRTYIASDRGSYWTKLRARNPNYQYRPMRVLTGYLVDGVYDRANFQELHFIVDQMDVGNGQCKITGKDPLKLAEAKKALAPANNTGQLNAGISAGAGSLTLKPVGIGALEYAASGSIIINDEIMDYTRTSDVLTITRGQEGTTAAAHSIDDVVQICLIFNDQVHAIVEDLLVNYAGIDPAFIDSGAWQSEIDLYISGLLFGIVQVPTDVGKLLQELGQAQPHYLYWDERAKLIKLEAIKAPPASANPLDMDSNLIKNSVKIKDEVKKRASTILVNYGRIDNTKSVDDIDNYSHTWSRTDTDSITKYGSNQVMVITSRWISSSNRGQAIRLAALHGMRFSNIPRSIKFQLDPKDADVWIGQTRQINHRDIVDNTGLPKDTLFQITSAQESTNFNYKGLEFEYGDALPDDLGGGDPDVDLVFISVDAKNVNLRTEYDALFPSPDATTEAKFIVDAGVVVGSTSTGTNGMETGSWPVGAIVTLVNSGHIVGKGGNGSYLSGSAGAGGDAINMTYDLVLENNGVIGSGGGGGGFANDGSSPIAHARGGGGAGCDVGSSEGFGGGENGTLEMGGEGGFERIEGENDTVTARAGDGGNLGKTGASGVEGGPLGAGAIAGNAINKNGNTLTETTTGDIRGDIV